MFTIRTAQIEALERTETPEFIAYVAGRLRARWTGYCSAMDGAALVAVINAASNMAARFDLESYADACRCAELMIVFGMNVQQDAPWAGEVLEGSANLPLPAQFEALWRRALQEPEFAPAAEAPATQPMVL